MIVIASDHAGFELKQYIIKNFPDEFLDLGCDSVEAVDYPDYAYKLAKAIQEKKANIGVLICGSGIGMSIAANRFPNIRAALCTNALMAKFAREHNDANILVLGARIIDEKTAIECLSVFMNTPFKGERHQIRIDKLKGD